MGRLEVAGFNMLIENQIYTSAMNGLLYHIKDNVFELMRNGRIVKFTNTYTSNLRIANDKDIIEFLLMHMDFAENIGEVRVSLYNDYCNKNKEMLALSTDDSYKILSEEQAYQLRDYLNWVLA
jgi:hypothetical protein